MIATRPRRSIAARGASQDVDICRRRVRRLRGVIRIRRVRLKPVLGRLAMKPVVVMIVVLHVRRVLSAAMSVAAIAARSATANVGVRPRRIAVSVIAFPPIVHVRTPRAVMLVRRHRAPTATTVTGRFRRARPRHVAKVVRPAIGRSRHVTVNPATVNAAVRHVTVGVIITETAHREPMLRVGIVVPTVGVRRIVATGRYVISSVQSGRTIAATSGRANP